MKVCSKCGDERPTSLFSKSARSKDGLFSWCKPCMAAYEKERYHNGDKERKVRNKKKAHEDNTEFIWNYLSSHPCVDCGNSDPLVLEFDHRDGVIKLRNVCEMYHYSLTKIIEEIEKCEVRCANCHRKRTILQRGSWRGMMEATTGV